mgnify:CR=1 FL=1
MKEIMISPTNKASQRTKNRIREHGPIFRAECSRAFPDGILFGELCWLLRAEDGWLGWLPRGEFDFTHADQFPTNDADFRDMMPDSEEFYHAYTSMGWKD